MQKGFAEFFDDRTYYCACTFMKNVKIFGGHGLYVNINGRYINNNIISCLKYNTLTDIWWFCENMSQKKKIQHVQQGASVAPTFELSLVKKFQRGKSYKQTTQKKLASQLLTIGS